MKNNDKLVVDYYPKTAIESDERESEVANQITSKTIASILLLIQQSKIYFVSKCTFLDLGTIKENISCVFFFCEHWFDHEIRAINYAMKSFYDCLLFFR